MKMRNWYFWNPCDRSWNECVRRSRVLIRKSQTQTRKNSCDKIIALNILHTRITYTRSYVHIDLPLSTRVIYEAIKLWKRRINYSSAMWPIIELNTRTRVLHEAEHCEKTPFTIHPGRRPREMNIVPTSICICTSTLYLHILVRTSARTLIANSYRVV